MTRGKVLAFVTNFLAEGKGGGFLVKKYPERLRTVSVRDRYELMDADSPEDLAFLVER